MAEPYVVDPVRTAGVAAAMAIMRASTPVAWRRSHRSDLRSCRDLDRRSALRMLESCPAGGRLMAALTFIRRNGYAQELQVSFEGAIKETIRNAGLDELVAMRGGSCACATCQAYVESDEAHLSTMCAHDDDLFDSSAHRRTSSRLSCQMSIDGAAVLRVRIATKD